MAAEPQAADTTLTAKEAIRIAFDRFREYFEQPDVTQGLLEGLEFDEHADEWHVTIGFDAGRFRETGPTLIGSLAGALREQREPIREFRRFVIDAATGTSKRMANN